MMIGATSSFDRGIPLGLFENRLLSIKKCPRRRTKSGRGQTCTIWIILILMQEATPLFGMEASKTLCELPTLKQSR